MSIQDSGLTAEPPSTDAPEDHRLFRRDEFWRALPGYADVSAETFNSRSLAAVGCLPTKYLFFSITSRLAPQYS